MPSPTNQPANPPGPPNWAALLAFLLLGASHLVAGIWLGRTGTLITAIVAEIAWLSWRPWRWGNSTTGTRKFVKWAGTLALGIFIVIAARLFWHPPGG